MIKNELYNNLTWREKAILDRAIEGKEFTECNPNDVMLNVHIEEIDERASSENPYCLDLEVYEDIRRFINSQIDNVETRKNKLLVKGKQQYTEEQKYIDEAISEGRLKAEDILLHVVQMEDNIIKYLGIDYGFTKHQVFELMKLELNLHGIDENIQL